MMRAAITAPGHYLPPDVYPNAYFEQQLDTTDVWIRGGPGMKCPRCPHDNPNGQKFCGEFAEALP